MELNFWFRSDTKYHAVLLGYILNKNTKASRGEVLATAAQLVTGRVGGGTRLPAFRFTILFLQHPMERGCRKLLFINRV